MEHSKVKVEKDTKEPEDPKVDLKMRNKHVTKVHGTGVGNNNRGSWSRGLAQSLSSVASNRLWLADPTIAGKVNNSDLGGHAKIAGAISLFQHIKLGQVLWLQ